MKEGVRMRYTCEIISTPMQMVRSLSLWICTRGKMVNFCAGSGAVGVSCMMLLVQEGWCPIRVWSRDGERPSSTIAIGFVRRGTGLLPLFAMDCSLCWREYLFIRLNSQIIQTPHSFIKIERGRKECETGEGKNEGLLLDFSHFLCFYKEIHISYPKVPYSANLCKFFAHDGPTARTKMNLISARLETEAADASAGKGSE